ncbi:hypothetical protein TWF694_003528 [Orbilia ellipsospora]|uniref:Uncharacterized protein n=1 Tax=Orbilia ellipsospora TaxID=2528407 RepID=A0AAV9WYI2_9PEZI
MWCDPRCSINPNSSFSLALSSSVRRCTFRKLNQRGLASREPFSHLSLLPNNDLLNDRFFSYIFFWLLFKQFGIETGGKYNILKSGRMSRTSAARSILLSLFALLFLNLVNTTLAASTPLQPEICDSSSIIITTPDELFELSNCTDLPGDVYLNNVDSVELHLYNITSIGGMFQIHLANNTQRFSALNLTSIGGLFMVAGDTENSSQMEEIDIPNLNNTAGLDLTRMPLLRDLEFPARINNPNPAIRVTIMNTGLESIEPLNIDYEQIQQIYFGGNPNLNNITMGLKQITVNMDIDGAGGTPNVSFPELTYLNTANIHNISTLDFPKLKSMGGALGVYDSIYLETLSLPVLEKIGTKTLSVLAIANNSALEDVLFPVLTQITGGITTENNKKWQRLTGFPELSVVTDDVDMQGSFTIVSLPDLYNLTGSFSIISSAGLTYTCTDLEKLNTDTSKPFICDPYGVNVYRAADTPTTEKKTAQGSPLTGPKITGIAIGCLAAVVAPLIFIRFLVGRKRKAKLKEKDIYNRHWNPVDYGSRSLPGSRAELPTDPGPFEMPPAAKLRQELVGDIPLHEMDGTPPGKKHHVDISSMPVPDSPIERVSTGGSNGRFDSDVSRLDTDDVSSEDEEDEYNDSIVHAYVVDHDHDRDSEMGGHPSSMHDTLR